MQASCPACERPIAMADIAAQRSTLRGPGGLRLVACPHCDAAFEVELSPFCAYPVKLP